MSKITFPFPISGASSSRAQQLSNLPKMLLTVCQSQYSAFRNSVQEKYASLHLPTSKIFHSPVNSPASPSTIQVNMQSTCSTRIKHAAKQPHDFLQAPLLWRAHWEISAQPDDALRISHVRGCIMSLVEHNYWTVKLCTSPVLLFSSPVALFFFFFTCLHSLAQPLHSRLSLVGVRNHGLSSPKCESLSFHNQYQM
ncbi:hypothetical protein BKA65DRAFT_179306 [Rhexocercosporidium sp. MPI-PUGE-AT-0058]|nr:hypothetical protein BKA65DRAFT_179306 [Rhexocercosporidium sp. MPI-PUGE-AT-0058]